METLIIRLDDKQKAKALKIILNAMQISFEDKAEKPYCKEFVEKIKKGEAEFNSGDHITITSAEIWK
jgi:hypothetical protein